MTAKHSASRWLLILVVALLAGLFTQCTDQPGRADAGPAKPDLPFKVPDGFVAQRVAGPPVVEYPITAGFDERGRLFVAHAAGHNVRNTQYLLDKRPNSIRLLGAADANGRFNEFTVFADNMTFPTGAVWHDGSLYCCSAPYLWKMQDCRNTGVADKRQELVGKFNFDGHAADIHGPFLGPDGRLYWSSGPDGYHVQFSDGTVRQSTSPVILRCKPNGEDVELVSAGGGNPVMMTFTAEGEAFATTTLLRNYPNRYDGMVYCIDGGAFLENRIPEFKLTGDLLTPFNLGHCAPSGLVRYRSSALGKEYQGNLFMTCYNTNKVQRLILERDGAGFRVRAEDFLVSDSKHFHPTFVLEDADGSLLVVDTGGWITVACYVSLLKPEAKGGIYRISRRHAPKLADPRGLALAWDKLKPAELVRLLDDQRFAVRDRAVFRLARQGAAALPALKETLLHGPSVRARRNAVWALTQMESPQARAVLRPALDDKEMSVRLAAAHAVGLQRDAQCCDPLTSLVVKDEPPMRRQAATALGRIKNARAIPAVLEALRIGGDRYLEHALIYALIQIADREGTMKGLSDRSPQVRRGALIALHQMANGNLTEELVTPLLDTDDPALQKAALEVLSSSGWSQRIVGLLGQWLAQKELSARQQESLRGSILALAKDPAIQQLVAKALQHDQTPLATRLLLLETIARAPLDLLPAAWAVEVGKCLQSRDGHLVRQALATIRAARVTNLDAQLVALARDKSSYTIDARLAALAAAAPRLAKLDADLFEMLLSQLGAEAAPLARLEAATALGSALLDDAQLQTLVKFLPRMGPLEMPQTLPAYEHSRDAKVGKMLVAALTESPAVSSLTSDVLRRTLQGYPEEVRQAARLLVKKLQEDPEKMEARLKELSPLLKGGDVGRGQSVFFGSKVNCSACHTVRSQGGKVGPDLSTIGAVRSAQELLESIVFPSASFARGFETYVVATKAGRLFGPGIIRLQTADAIYLTSGDLAEIRIARSDIDTLEPAKVSIMPQGLDLQMSRPELADLIAFLQSLR
jgi:putative membrane-bound dehydrogenase-like protein